jgi:hypothetical protein
MNRPNKLIYRIKKKMIGIIQKLILSKIVRSNLRDRQNFHLVSNKLKLFQMMINLIRI